MTHIKQTEIDENGIMLKSVIKLSLVSLLMWWTTSLQPRFDVQLWNWDIHRPEKESLVQQKSL